MQHNQKIGISSAAKAIGWPVARFAKYYYEGRSPKYFLVDNQPVWELADLEEWKRTYPFKSKGRPKGAAKSSKT